MKENMNNAALMMAKGTMTFETFLDTMKDALTSRIGDCTVEIQERKKNNGVLLHGVCIREEESNTAPVIYLDEAFGDYQRGRSFDEIVTAVVESYMKSRLAEDVDMGDITDYERAKEKLCFKVVNTELNRELLSSVPHLPFFDLSVVFYVLLESIPGQNASVMVSDDLMTGWGVDTDTLFEVAKPNTQRIFEGSVMPMKDIIEDILADRDDGMEGPLPDEACGMYVATNEEGMNGAAVFLYDSLLSEFADKIGADFYIIPSSVHELIFLPDGPYMEPEDIRRMISEVNSACVGPEDILSNSLYRYRRETGRVEIAA